MKTIEKDKKPELKKSAYHHGDLRAQLERCRFGFDFEFVAEDLPAAFERLQRVAAIAMVGVASHQQAPAGLVERILLDQAFGRMNRVAKIVTE